MSLRTPDTASPEAIRKLAQDNLVLSHKNKKLQAQNERYREALEAISKCMGKYVNDSENFVKAVTTAQEALKDD